MLFMSLRPPDRNVRSSTDGFSKLALSTSIFRAEDVHQNHHHYQHPNDHKLFYKLLKKQWNANRSNSEGNRNTKCSLHRRLSSPVLGQNEECRLEMSTPVKNNSSWWSISTRTPKRTISLRFWRTEEYSDDNIDLCALLHKTDITCAKDIGHLSDVFKKRMLKKRMSATEAAECVQSIYRALDMRLRRGITFEDLTEARAGSMMKTFEEFFIRNLYEELFTMIASEERTADSALADKIESMYWVNPSHLAAKIDELDPQVCEVLDKAILDMTAMTFMESAVEKIDCIMNCSRRIFELLRIRADASESADDFLPVMVYVVLQSNPPLLPSNIRFILQFGNSDKFMTGEEGYYFTHLCSAVSFIEKASGRLLGMTEEAFVKHSSEDAAESHSNLGSSQNAAPSRRRLSRYICKAYHRAAEVQAAKHQQDNLRKKTASLKQEIMQLKEEISSSMSRPTRLKELEDNGILCFRR